MCEKKLCGQIELVIKKLLENYKLAKSIQYFEYKDTDLVNCNGISVFLFDPLETKQLSAFCVH